MRQAALKSTRTRLPGRAWTAPEGEGRAQEISARDHGAMPRSVELWLLSSRIAPPSAVVPGDRAERFLEGATRKRLRRTECASEPHGQWPGEPGFVPLPVKPGRWEGVRAKQGPLWPYDEWIGWAVIVGMVVVVWRRRTR